MLTAKAKREVELAKATRKLSLIASVNTSVSLTEIAQIRDVDERMRRLDAVYQLAKQPFLEALYPYKKAGLRIVDLLEGTPNVIVSGPAATWRRFIEESSSLVADPAIEIQSNSAEWTLA